MANKSSVLVVGGGLVGATAALALAQLGFGVTLIDRRRPQPNPGPLGIELRNFALSPGSQALLQRHRAWPSQRVAPYNHMTVWEQWGTAQIEFDAAMAGCDQLGWLVEMSTVVEAVWQQIEASGRVEVLIDEIDALAIEAEYVEVTTGQGLSKRFDFLVAADGAQSIAKRALGLEVAMHPTNQVALATVVRTANSHQNTAWQRFLSDGPLAFLPSPDPQVCSIVWSQSESFAQQRMALTDEQFCLDIAHAIEHRLGDVLAVDQRVVFPLAQQRVKECVPHPRVLLVGDALRVVHPLAGQGVNLGLEDVEQLLRVAAEQTDLSAPGIWREYARHRQTRARLMIQIMSALQKVYANTNPLIGLLRNIGVQSINALEPIKLQIMREAMGLTRVP